MTSKHFLCFSCLKFTHFSRLPLLSKLFLAKSDASPYILISHISVLCLVDKWSVKVTAVEHLRRSENTNVFLSLLPNFANTSPHFCKFCPLTKSLCRRQGAKSDRTVEQVEQLVKKKRPVIRFEKTNAFFTRPPDSDVAAVQVKVDRGERR